MELIISIIGVITAVLSFILSCSGIIHNRYKAVDDYFTKMEDEKFIEARKHIYNIKNDELRINDEQIAMVVNYFHHWGILAKKRYLPTWVFDDEGGNGVCRMYDKTKKIH